MKKILFVVIALLLFGNNVFSNNKEAKEKNSEALDPSIVEETLILSDETYVSQLPYYISPEDSTRCLNALVKEIDRLLNKISKTKLSVAIYSIDQDKYIYTKNFDKPLTPASNTKLVTSFCAFDFLGPDHIVKTNIYINDKNIDDAVVNGDVIIEGMGDALLSITDVEFIADQIKSLGINKVTGNIYADGTFFDSLTNRKVYSGDADEVEKLPPVVSLGMEKNTATVVVSTGVEYGTPASIQVIPNSESFFISNSAKSANTRKKCRVISKWNGSKNMQQFSILGSMRANKTYSFRHYIMQPDLAVAGALKDRLITGGVEVVGKVDKIRNHKNDRTDFYLLCQYGRDIQHFMNPINQMSNNYLAENMFKMLGAHAKLSDTTAISSQLAEREILASYEIPFENCKLNDGSGLSRRNLLTTHTLCEVLISAYYSDFYHEFYSSLAVAGMPGNTLRKRMKKTAAQGNLHAKTGTLKNASALSGFVTSVDGERFVFSCLFNGWAVGTYKNTENAIGELLASFFYYNRSN
ncbi:MAG: D-alanyl-D-alanine carboxypeptidase/D-alanyl-D-alanine-endopeptidase [Bacteroidetes bacterium 4572_77]|nr:MAG: D-alanyl-D-alanine carboxypeptidase/D-alanyl-D-alanine-endopeptidase [Bacteroidetes bacterium 4572_77]